MSAATLVGFDALGGAELEAWHRLRASNPHLDSPYFHPGFAAAVHASGQPVHVAVVRDGRGTVTALLPGHREGALLRPVGWPGADFQGPITADGTAFPALAVLTGGIRRYAFDHLLNPCPDFAPWVRSTRESPYLDCTGGLDGYLGRASRSGRDNMGQARRRTARAERDLGPVRFAADVVDAGALAEVVRLKRAQYRATGARDYFAGPGRVELLTRLMHTRDPGFGGILSTLYAGPHLLAAHFGMRAGPVLHWWFPVYEPGYGNLAPGWILLRELVAAAPALGVTRIDFGRGDDEYKRRAKTGGSFVSQGLLTRSATGLALHRAGTSLAAAARTSPLGPGLRRIVHALRALRR